MTAFSAIGHDRFGSAILAEHSNPFEFLHNFQVVLKILKHCQEEGSGSDLVQGVLLGLVENSRLEITNCFPFPRHTEDEDFDECK